MLSTLFQPKGGNMRRLLTPLLLLTTFSFMLSAQSQKRLGLSLRDQALQTLSNGDLESAASLYERWLEADPRDKDSWYNLACIRALAGNKAAALDAWENAVEAGFTDAAFAQRDGDLQSVRDD